jgi:hypothetical protein
MRQTQLQSGPLDGGMQHLDCRIGDFGPDPIARQHADPELALIRHPISPSAAVSGTIIPDSSGTSP